MVALPSQLLLDHLAHLLGPKGFTRDPESINPWLTDWRGRYHGAAAAMLMPQSVDEVSQIVRLCAQASVPLVTQGGNTSMVGGATPSGDGNSLILSMRRMNRIRTISPHREAVCEAGVVLADLHAAALREGCRFPLSLAAKGSATIGGLVSTNAGGTQVLRFGTMRHLVLGIEAVLADGSVYQGLRALKKDNRGYDLRHLLIGAEGTLGVVTAATLKLVPAAGARTVAWVGMNSPQSALSLLRLVEEKCGDAVEAFELIPDVALQLVLSHIADTRPPLQGSHSWHALIELTFPIGGEGPRDNLEVVLQTATDKGVAEDAVIASSEKQAEALWRLRESISDAERIEGHSAKHDVSVAVDEMPEFILDAAKQVERRFPGTRVIAFGHLGDGNVHFNVQPPEGVGPNWLTETAPGITSFVHDLVVAAGGSISAEHGIGQMRLAELARLTDPARLNAMRAIKKALDPNGILNPGKLVPLA